MPCELFANKPKLDGAILIGEGGRECSGSAPPATNITVRLKWDRRFWFDKTLAEKTQAATGLSTTVSVSYQCKGLGGKKVYTETVASTGGKVQSPRAGVFCG